MARKKTLVASARCRRIASFLDQVDLYLAQRCIESSIAHARTDDFCNELFAKMVGSREPLPVIDLLRMLTSEEVREELFDAYKEWLVANY